MWRYWLLTHCTVRISTPGQLCGLFVCQVCEKQPGGRIAAQRETLRKPLALSVFIGLIWFDMAYVVGIVVILAHGFTFECHAFEGFLLWITMNMMNSGAGGGLEKSSLDPILHFSVYSWLHRRGSAGKLPGTCCFFSGKIRCFPSGNGGKCRKIHQKNQPKSRWLESGGIFRTMWLWISQQVISTS